MPAGLDEIEFANSTRFTDGNRLMMCIACHAQFTVAQIRWTYCSSVALDHTLFFTNSSYTFSRKVSCLPTIFLSLWHLLHSETQGFSDL